MSQLIREFVPGDLDAVVGLSLRAWEPVHVSIAEAFGPELNGALNPDWRASQERDVIEVCTAPAESRVGCRGGGAVVGFVAVRIHDDRRIGEIEMLAVDPAAQNDGIGTALTELALGWIREAGIPVAMVGRARIPGHAPARRTYEKAGLKLVPVARYFKKL